MEKEDARYQTLEQLHERRKEPFLKVVLIEEWKSTNHFQNVLN